MTSTPLSPATLLGSRCAVDRLNQPVNVRKGEPEVLEAASLTRLLKVLGPSQENRSTIERVLDASPLLVILHYLLKNNTAFMMWFGQVKASPPHRSVLLLHGGDN